MNVFFFFQMVDYQMLKDENLLLKKDLDLVKGWDYDYVVLFQLP